ncbi:GPI anchored protein [Balamuthia mandrillaris]
MQITRVLLLVMVVAVCLNLAHAFTTPRYTPAYNSKQASLRQETDATEEDGDEECIPCYKADDEPVVPCCYLGDTCCSDGLSCTPPGGVCCEEGHSCDAGQVCCGAACMPAEADCCEPSSTHCLDGRQCVVVEDEFQCASGAFLKPALGVLVVLLVTVVLML